ncbi:MAG: VIT domain-containing protein [bacterium]
MISKRRFRKCGLPIVLVLIAQTSVAQPHETSVARPHRTAARGLASNVLVPQAAVSSARVPGQIEIAGVEVGVVIQDQAATTTMEISLANSSGARQEAELVVPVPDDAVVRGFIFEGASDEPTAELLSKEDGRRTYDAIVAKRRDPALLEFIGYNLIRTSVFPVEAKGTQKIRLAYEHILPAYGDRIDYVLPRSESIDYAIPWKISVRIKSKRPISTVYSPSHKLDIVRSGQTINGDGSPGGHIVSARIAEDSVKEPGPFRLSYLVENNDVNASLFAYPDPKQGGGYFLLLAGLPAKPFQDADRLPIKREVTLVIDRSGSMKGEKIRQVCDASLQILSSLEKGEAFNILVYNDTVDLFSRDSVSKNNTNIEAARKYIESVDARGGTNIHDALTEALRQKRQKGMLPIVLFFTDGLPTVGQTSEMAIRDVAMKSNPHKRRIFTFGVGVDVNTPLLEKIASETRATSTFVLPGENVEDKISRVFEDLSGPVLAELNCEIVDSSGDAAPGRVRDLIPAQLPDLFEGNQLVLLGQYIGEEPLTFLLSGNYLGTQRTFRFHFNLDNATTRNDFVPRLWASRKIACLVDAVRQLGANGGPNLAQSAQAASRNDPKLKELTEEILRLSIDFGVLTEYTAFLAQEGTDLSQRDQVLTQAVSNFSNRAMNVRTGLGGVNQVMNTNYMGIQQARNFSNSFWDENMNRVSITTVQQVHDRTFYRQGAQWVDSRIIEQQSQAQPDKVIEFGSDEFRDLAYRLAEEGRQSSISLRGDILLLLDGDRVLIKGPAPQ